MHAIGHAMKDDMWSKVHNLIVRLRQVQHVFVRANMALTLIQIASWAALLAVPAVMVQRARRRRVHHALAGAGDDKAPGHENPTSDDIAHHD
jgi:hypothetical protein